MPFTNESSANPFVEVMSETTAEHRNWLIVHLSGNRQLLRVHGHGIW